MRFRTLLFLVISHVAVGVFGFAAGIYFLPILTAPPSPTEAVLQETVSAATFTGEFRKDLEGSDAFHWGEGTVSVGNEFITLEGKLAPGPDYKLYLSPELVETEAQFNQLKNTMVRVGDIKTFDNFVLEVPAGIEPAQYSSVIIWCETFGEFITAAKYQ